MTINSREKKYIRQLISLGCSKGKAIELAKLQREVWERQEDVEDARVVLRAAIRKALHEEPRFSEGLNNYAAKHKPATN